MINNKPAAVYLSILLLLYTWKRINWQFIHRYEANKTHTKYE